MSSPKFSQFIHALEALCKEHGVQLAVSGYDGLQVWDLEEGSEPIYANGIEDRTEAGSGGGQEDKVS